MSVETTTDMLVPHAPTLTEQSMTEPVDVKRTPAEKARILTRLMLALAAIEKQKGRMHGDA